MGLITGSRAGVSQLRPDVVVNFPMRAMPSLLEISNMHSGLDGIYKKGKVAARTAAA